MTCPKCKKQDAHTCVAPQEEILDQVYTVKEARYFFIHDSNFEDFFGKTPQEAMDDGMEIEPVEGGSWKVHTGNKHL